MFEIEGKQFAILKEPCAVWRESGGHELVYIWMFYSFSDERLTAINQSLETSLKEILGEVLMVGSPINSTRERCE